MKLAGAQTTTQPKTASQKTFIINYERTAEGVRHIPQAFKNFPIAIKFDYTHKNALLAFFELSDKSEEEKAEDLKDIIIKISRNYPSPIVWKACLTEIAKNHTNILQAALECKITHEGMEISEIMHELSQLKQSNSNYRGKKSAFLDCLKSKKEIFGEYIVSLEALNTIVEPQQTRARQGVSAESTPNPQRYRQDQVDNLNTANTSAPLLPPAVINVDADNLVYRQESALANNLKKRAAEPKANADKRQKIKRCYSKLDPISENDMPDVVLSKLKAFRSGVWVFDELCSTKTIDWLNSIRDNEVARKQAAEDLARIIIQISNNQKKTDHWDLCIGSIATYAKLSTILHDALRIFTGKLESGEFKVTNEKVKAKLNDLIKGLSHDNRFNGISEEMKRKVSAYKNAKSTSNRPMRRSAQNAGIPVALQEHIHDDGEFLLKLPEMTLEDIQLHMDTIEEALQKIHNTDAPEAAESERYEVPYADLINAYLNLDAFNEPSQNQETVIQTTHIGSDPEPLPNQDAVLPAELAVQIPNIYIPSAIPATVVNTYATAAMPTKIATTPVVTNDAVLHDTSHAGRLQNNTMYNSQWL